MNVLDLFSGIGGFSLGLERAGMKTIAFCEYNEAAQRVLRKHWPDVPVYKDVRTLDGSQFRGTVNVVCGGFPCQDLSRAGRQDGIEGQRSNLYTEMLRIISECRPEFAIFENVTNLLTGESGRWFAQFLYDLAAVGYDAQWHCISASAVGAAHHRDRIWIIAYPNGTNSQGIFFPKPLFAYSEESRRRQYTRAVDEALPADDYACQRGNFDDVPERMDRLKQLGNSVVPLIPEIIGRAILRSREATA